MFDWITQVDFAILDLIQQYLRTAFGDWLMVVLTTLGNAGMLWIVISVVLLFHKSTRKCGLLILITMAVGYLLNDMILKNIVARLRPCVVRPEMLTLLDHVPSGYSFMSGHAQSSFAAATVIFLHHKKWSIPAYIVAALIAFSRLYVYVHFPTDVLAGTLSGILLAIGAVKGTDAWLQYRREKKIAF